MIQNVSEKI